MLVSSGDSVVACLKTTEKQKKRPQFVSQPVQTKKTCLSISVVKCSINCTTAACFSTAFNNYAFQNVEKLLKDILSLILSCNDISHLATLQTLGALAPLPFPCLLTDHLVLLTLSS